MSSAPSSEIHIVGDFTITNDFSFVGDIVKINSGVTIYIAPNATLTVDNSMLFSCDGLWKGISMGEFSTIKTLNDTQIEDAEIAIQSINQVYSFLDLEKTTFNRNRTGIELRQDQITPHGSVIINFKNNKFECTAPLNNTEDEITNIGIKLKNINNPFLNNQLVNRFKGIQVGISSEGKTTQLKINSAFFSEIRTACIYFTGGRVLKVEESSFNEIYNYGIDYSKTISERYDF